MKIILGQKRFVLLKSLQFLCIWFAGAAFTRMHCEDNVCHVVACSFIMMVFMAIYVYTCGLVAGLFHLHPFEFHIHRKAPPSR